jgi:hypothetical protein
VKISTAATLLLERHGQAPPLSPLADDPLDVAEIDAALPKDHLGIAHRKSPVGGCTHIFASSCDAQSPPAQKGKGDRIGGQQYLCSLELVCGMLAAAQ